MWNAAFGRAALEVIDAPAGATPGDPRYHLISWVEDDDLALGRGMHVTDPRTGQILQGLITISSGWARVTPAKLATLAITAAAPEDLFPGLRAQLLCERNDADRAADPTLQGEDDDALIFRGLRAVVAHEVGHVLGLRHNFAGSLAAEDDLPSGSIMDYLPFGDDVRMDRVGTYDRAAIGWAYELTDAAPPGDLLFCTDDHLPELWWLAGPKFADCQKRDHGPDPIAWWPEYIALQIDRYNQWILTNAVVPAARLNRFVPDLETQGAILFAIWRARMQLQMYADPQAIVWLLNDRFPQERRARAYQALGQMGMTPAPQPAPPPEAKAVLGDAAIARAVEELLSLTAPRLPDFAAADSLADAPLVRPALAATIRALETQARGNDPAARWAENTLAAIARALGQLHAALGR